MNVSKRAEIAEGGRRLPYSKRCFDLKGFSCSPKRENNMDPGGDRRRLSTDEAADKLLAYYGDLFEVATR